MKKINQAQVKTLLNKHSIPEYHPHWRAVGYLEALKKAKILEDGYEQLKKHLNIIGGKAVKLSPMAKIIDRTLEKWRRVK